MRPSPGYLPMGGLRILEHSMRIGLFSLFGAGLLAVCAVANTAQAAKPELRVMTHSSFALPKPLLAQFEADAGVKLRIIKGGDAGEMLNKLILTRAKPVADVVFGIDNALIGKALAAQVIDAYDGPASTRTSVAPLQDGVVPVNYGYVTVNYDKAWFEKKALALPQSLQDLTLAAYAKLLVVQNPATSSPGKAFLLATIGAMGEEKAFDWWARMRANGVKVVKGWSDAYYTEFSHNGGARPLVISYATSPAAEVFYSKTKLTEPPTGSLSLPGGVFRQVEGVALVKGGGQRGAAGQFIEFMRSPAVQQAMQTEMWMYPAQADTARADVMRFAPEPSGFDNPGTQAIAMQSAAWVSRWTQVVLK
jgi:thiamine transport system substrate-binding protein